MRNGLRMNLMDGFLDCQIRVCAAGGRQFAQQKMDGWIAVLRNWLVGGGAVSECSRLHFLWTKWELGIIYLGSGWMDGQ